MRAATGDHCHQDYKTAGGELLEPHDERARAFETPLRALIGERIARVRYFEINYFDGQAHWFDDPRFDSLDFGLTLELQSGGEVAVTWGNEWACWGLSFNAGLLPHEDCRTADVTHESRWRRLVDSTITFVDFEWQPFETSAGGVVYPQTARLTFAHGTVVFPSAFEYRLPDEYYGFVDHITVFFESPLAIAFNVWDPKIHQS